MIYRQQLYRKSNANWLFLNINLIFNFYHLDNTSMPYGPFSSSFFDLWDWLCNQNTLNCMFLSCHVTRHDTLYASHVRVVCVTNVLIMSSLTKWLIVRLLTKWLWVRAQLQRLRTCFKQGVPWHSGNYRVWIQSEMRTWHDKNIQSNAPYR